MEGLPALSTEDEATAQLGVTLHPPAEVRGEEPRPTARRRTQESAHLQEALLGRILLVPRVLWDRGGKTAGMLQVRFTCITFQRGCSLLFSIFVHYLVIILNAMMARQRD